METTRTPALQPAPKSWSPRRIATYSLGGLIALLLVFQVVPYGRDHTNPAVSAEPAWDSPQTRVLFFRACADCHSNATIWPAYSNIAPISWLAYRDVVEGRAVLNVSEWGRADNKADESAETVQKNEMPPWFYLPLHPTANLTTIERQQMIDGLKATFGGEN
jgi:mono/diheme cytochrome c family protein